MDGLKNEKWMVNNFKTSSGITHESKSGQTKLYTCTVCQKVEIDQWKHAALGHGILLLVHPSHALTIENGSEWSKNWCWLASWGYKFMSLISVVWAWDWNGCTKSHIQCPNAARFHLSSSTIRHTVYKIFK